MSIRAIKNVASDTFGQVGIVTSITLNVKSGEVLNLWLTIVISVLTIVYMGIKIAKEIRKK